MMRRCLKSTCVFLVLKIYKLLTFATLKTRTSYLNVLIEFLFKKCKFKTWWLTNTLRFIDDYFSIKYDTFNRLRLEQFY